MSNKKLESRRNFLKGTTAVATGAALLSGLNLSLARAAHPAGSDEIKIALIGCGGRGSGAAKDNLTACKNTKFVAIADAFEDRAKASAQSLGVPEDKAFSGLDAYKRAIDADIDMVILATPPGFRPIHYAAAIEAGKHVFMEKPCCVDAPGFRSLLKTNELADKKGLKVGVGLQRHHQASYVNGISQIHNGKLGDLLLVEAYWNGGFIWWRNAKEGFNELQKQVHNWYHFCWLSGDNICEQHVHNLDVCNWAKNAHPVLARGMGAGKRRRDKNPDSQIFDHHFVEFFYPDGTKMYSQCRQVDGCWGLVDEYAFGTNKHDSMRAEGNEKDVNGLEFKFSNPYEQEHYALVEAIRNNLPYNEGHYGATSSFTAVLGRMATYSGQEVKWDDAVENGKSLAPGLAEYTWDSTPPTLPKPDGTYRIAVPGISSPYDPFNY